MTLPRGLAIGASRTHIHIFRPAGHRTVRFPHFEAFNWIDFDSDADALIQEVCSRVARPEELARALEELDPGDRQDLTLRPRDSLGVGGLGGFKVVTLAAAISDPTTAEGQDVLVHARGEVLWLSDSHSPEQRRAALRLVASGLSPLGRRECYGFAATSGRACLAGDTATVGDLAAATALAGERRPDVPTLYVLGGPRPGSFRLGDAPGRLHACQGVKGHVLSLAGIHLHVATATIASPNLNSAVERAGICGWGVDPVAETAMAKAIAEGVERFAMSSVPDDLLVARAEDLLGPYLDPRDVISHTFEQIARRPVLRPFAPDEVRSWIAGENEAGKAVYVLADLVFRPFSPPGEDHRVHSLANSSGLASHTSATVARVKALNEVIERDAFMRSWLTGIPERTIDISGLNQLGRSLVGAAESHGAVQLISLPSPWSTVVLAIGFGEFGVVTGLAAGEPVAACNKALIELVASLEDLTPRIPVADPKSVLSSEDHAAYYRGRDARAYVDFWLDSPHPSHTLTELKHRHASLRRFEGGVFVRLPGAGAGSHEAWRCLAPGLVPLTFGFDMEPLGLESVQKILKRRPECGYLASGQLPPHPLG